MRLTSSAHQTLLLPLLMTAIMLMMASACKPASSPVNSSIGINKSQASEWQDISEVGLPRIALSGFGQANTAAVDIMEEAEGSSGYLDLHSQFKMQSLKQCRRHLHPQVGADVIERNNEQLVAAYCDYVIYLNKGRILNVAVNHPQLIVYMIRPSYHDFKSDGPLQAVADDRYTFRIKYVGVEYQADPLNYDLTVTIR